jgi:hypothetical protein
MSSKRGQEEIVGFVAIILVVAIIAIIILGIALRNDNSTIKESKDVRRFIDGAFQYTSDCALGYEPNYATLKDLIKSCYGESGKTCLDERQVCLALNQTLKGLLDASWQVGPESSINSYEFNSYYSTNVSENVTNIVEFQKGNCTTEVYVEGSDFFSAYPGTITSSLKLCYSASN